jgi:hypothetical protein
MHPEGLAAWLRLVDAATGEAARAQALTREAARYFRHACWCCFLAVWGGWC